MHFCTVNDSNNTNERSGQAIHSTPTYYVKEGDIIKYWISHQGSGYKAYIDNAYIYYNN